METDAERIQHVISNLVSNAVKYTQPGTEVGANAATLQAGYRAYPQNHRTGYTGCCQCPR